MNYKVSTLTGWNMDRSQSCMSSKDCSFLLFLVVLALASGNFLTCCCWSVLSCWFEWDPLEISGTFLLHSSLFSKSLPWLPGSISSAQGACQTPPDSCCPHHDLQTLQAANGDNWRAISSVSHLSKITVLCYLMSDILTTIVSYILSGF